MKDTIEIALNLICTVRRETARRWVAGCAALDVYSQGKTREEAKGCLEEAILIWVESCLERGTLDEALREIGFHKVAPTRLRRGGASQAADLPADTFPIRLSIPAYQAAALLSA